MKTFLTLASFLVFLCSFNFQTESFQTGNLIDEQVNKITEYQRGWADGHCEGWKDVKGKYAYCPYPPYAPAYPTYPKSYNSYKDGYNDGFKRGMSDALKD